MIIMEYLKSLQEQPGAFLNNLPAYIDDCHQAAGHEKGINVRSVPRRIIFTGMGASYFAALPAVFFLQNKGIFAVAEETGVLHHYKISLITGDTALIIVSRSGESVEIKRLLQKLKGKGNPLIMAVTDNQDSYLARNATHVLLTRAGTDPPIALKTYTLTLALLLLLGAQLAGYDCDHCRRPLEAAAGAMSAFLENEERDKTTADALEFLGDSPSVIMLGRGASLASALEGALLFQEGARIMAAGYSGWQFRHGGVEVVDAAFRAIMFAPAGSSYQLQERLCEELISYGGKVLIISNGGPEAGEVLAEPVFPESIFPESNRMIENKITKIPGRPTGNMPRSRSHVLRVNAVHEFLAPLVEILPVQLMVYHLAGIKGIPVGVFRNASNVVTTE